jgi:hypothetical protein
MYVYYMYIYIYIYIDTYTYIYIYLYIYILLAGDLDSRLVSVEVPPKSTDKGAMDAGNPLSMVAAEMSRFNLIGSKGGCTVSY